MCSTYRLTHWWILLCFIIWAHQFDCQLGQAINALFIMSLIISSDKLGINGDSMSLEISTKQVESPLQKCVTSRLLINNL